MPGAETETATRFAEMRRSAELSHRKCGFGANLGVSRACSETSLGGPACAVFLRIQAIKLQTPDGRGGNNKCGEGNGGFDSGVSGSGDCVLSSEPRRGAKRKTSSELLRLTGISSLDSWSLPPYTWEFAVFFFFNLAYFKPQTLNVAANGDQADCRCS